MSTTVKSERAEVDAYLASAFNLERASGAPPLPELALEVRKLHDSDVLDTIHVGAAPVVTFGRHSESSVQLLHQSISRHHAAIVRDAHRGMLLVDLGSSEGTTLNGEPCPAKEGLQIARGDVICFAGSTRAYTVVIDGPDRLGILKARYVELEAELRLLEGEVSEESRTLPSDRPANEHPDARRIYVANLSFKAEHRDVAAYFEEATGVRVVNVQLPRNRDGELNGYGFVELDSSRGIKYALARNGDFFMGRNITVKMAVRKAGQKGGKAFGGRAGRGTFEGRGRGRGFAGFPDGRHAGGAAPSMIFD